MTTAIAKRKAARKRAPGAGALGAKATWRVRRARGLQIVEAPQLARLEWLVHGFSTRTGGESEMEGARKPRGGRERVLNLGFTEWDTQERVLKNREKFLSAVGASDMRLVTLRQIHSDIVHRVDGQGAGGQAAGEVRQGDALITREAGLLLAVQTADCVPTLLADTKRRAVAAIHAGWRGTVRRIAAKALGRMQMEFGTRPEDVVAAMGPSIGRCCYEVGADVVKEFQGQFPEAREWFEGPFDALATDEDANPLPWLTMRPPGHPAPEPRVQLDLIAANRAILAAAGVPAERISAAGLCTGCRGDLLFSYRRERETGRLMAVIGIR
jgi:polyphenol oxidase